MNRRFPADKKQDDARCEYCGTELGALLPGASPTKEATGREHDSERCRSLLKIRLVEAERKVRIVSRLMDQVGSCGETGCTSILTCDIKREWSGA